MTDFFSKTDKISDSSKTLFNRKINQWLEWIRRDALYLVQHSTEALKVLREAKISHSESNHHLYISAIVTLLRYGGDGIDGIASLGADAREKLLDEWIRIQRGNYTKVQERSGEPTQNQVVDGLVTWNEVVSVRNKMAGGSLEKLLFLMYTEIPPVRADHFATEIVYYPSKPGLSGENYVLIKSPDNIEYIIQDFKTAKLYETIRGRLPSLVCQELLLSLKVFPRKYLFVPGADGNAPFDRKTFSAWSTRVLSGAVGKHLTLTMLRHLYIGEKVDFNKSVRTLNKVSKAMGHSIGMQKGYHWIADEED